MNFRRAEEFQGTMETKRELLVSKGWMSHWLE